MSNADTNQEVVQAIVDAVMLAVNSKLSEYDKSVSAKLKNWKINGDQIIPRSLSGVALADGAVSDRTLADGAGGTPSQEVIEELVQKSFANVKIDVAQITDLSASVADIANASIKNAEIDMAQITSLSAGGIFTGDLLADGRVLISNLVVTEAMIVDLFAGNLIIRGDDGNMYAIKVAQDGSLKTEAKYITNDEIVDGTVNGAKIQDGSMNGGKVADGTMSGGKLVENAITAREIAANAVTANSILAGTITGDKLEANTITAREIDVGKLVTPLIESDLGKGLDLSSNESITMRVKNVQSAEPENPKVGELWLDTSGDEAVLKSWDGTNWVDTVDTSTEEEQIASLNTTTSGILDVLKQGYINATVSEAIEEIKQIQNEFTGELQAQSMLIENNAAQLALTPEKIQAAVTTAITPLNGKLEEYQSYVRLTANGLTVGQKKGGEESPFKIIINNEKMSFMQDDAEVAYVQYDRLHIKNAEIQQQQTLGHYLWQVFDDGSIGLLASN